MFVRGSAASAGCQEINVLSDRPFLQIAPALQQRYLVQVQRWRRPARNFFLLG